MDDEKIAKLRALYPRAMTRAPALLESDHIPPGRRWIQLKRAQEVMLKGARFSEWH